MENLWSDLKATLDQAEGQVQALEQKWKQAQDQVQALEQKWQQAQGQVQVLEEKLKQAEAENQELKEKLANETAEKLMWKNKYGILAAVATQSFLRVEAKHVKGKAAAIAPPPPPPPGEEEEGAGGGAEGGDAVVTSSTTRKTKRDYQCPCCPQRFRWPALLKHHLIKAHEIRLEPQWRCRGCRKACATWKARSIHQKKCQRCLIKPSPQAPVLTPPPDPLDMLQFEAEMPVLSFIKAELAQPPPSEVEEIPEEPPSEEEENLPPSLPRQRSSRRKRQAVTRLSQDFVLDADLNTSPSVPKRKRQYRKKHQTLPCRACDIVVTGGGRELERHVKKIHYPDRSVPPSNKYGWCKRCGINFNRIKDLKTHHH